MRPETEHLDHAADGASMYEISGVHRGFHVKTLAEINHVLALRFGGDAAGGVELIEGGERRFIREVVFASGHHANTDGAAFARYGGGGNQLDPGIVEDFVEGGRDEG